MMGELTVLVCSLASVVLVAMVLLVAVVASWERPAARRDDEAAALGEVREVVAGPFRYGRQDPGHLGLGEVSGGAGDALAWAAGAVGHARDSRAVPPATQAPRGGHTELLLDRFAREDAKAMGGELPAVWSACS